MSVAPNSPSARPMARAAPAARPGIATGIITRKKPRASEAPERARSVEQRGVHGRERGDRLADVERRGHERERHHHAGRGQRELDPRRVERAAENPRGPDRGQQPDPGHGGRQHQRELYQGHQEARPRNLRVASR